MDSFLNIAIDDLIHARTVESERVELKASWSDPTRDQLVRTVCAFANDLRNLGGGYIVLGVKEGQPPEISGLDEDLDALQKDILNACEQISPKYTPILSPETIEGRQVLAVWCPGGDHRPYDAPKDKKSGAARVNFVRKGPITRAPSPTDKSLLMEQAARVPWDDRRALEARVDALSPRLVTSFLREVGSGLDPEAHDPIELYRRLRLLARVNGHEVPRNVALLFFSERPESWFRGARIEFAHYIDGAGGDELEEHTFTGPLPEQIRGVLGHLDRLSGELVTKNADAPEASRRRRFPLPALEEAIVNAVYHRSYESVEPVKVYLHPDRLEVISYPGPVAGIRPKDLDAHAGSVAAPARNRRIGDFLKELRLAEARGTGVPKIRRAMEANGSPGPSFEFDEEHTWFRVTLPSHPDFNRPPAPTPTAHRVPSPGVPTRSPLGREAQLALASSIVGERPLCVFGARGDGVSSFLRTLQGRSDNDCLYLDLTSDPWQNHRRLLGLLPKIPGAGDLQEATPRGRDLVISESLDLLGNVVRASSGEGRPTLVIDHLEELAALACEAPGGEWALVHALDTLAVSRPVLGFDGPRLVSIVGDDIVAKLVDGCRMMQVGPLDESSATELASQLLAGAGAPTQLAPDLARLCEGHPGSLHYLVEELGLTGDFGIEEARELLDDWLARQEDPAGLGLLETLIKRQPRDTVALLANVLPAEPRLVQEKLSQWAGSQRKARQELQRLRLSGLVVEREGLLQLPWAQLSLALEQR